MEPRNARGVVNRIEKEGLCQLPDSCATLPSAGSSREKHLLDEKSPPK